MQDAPPASSDNVFAHMPPGAEGHFLLHFYAVIARLLAHLHIVGDAGKDRSGREGFEKRSAEPSQHANDAGASTASQSGKLQGVRSAQGPYVEQFPFLAGYQAALSAYLPGGAINRAPTEGAWWDEQIARWEAETPGHLPLRTLVEEAGLGADELRGLIAVGIVEEDIRFGALFAALQEPLAARRPCIGVLSWLLNEPGGLPIDAWQACRTLLEAGLLQVENRADPRAEWLLRVPSAIWDAIRGHPFTKPAPGLTLQAALNFPQLEDLILPNVLQNQVLRIPDLLTSDQVTALVLRGMSGSGRRTTLGSIARTLNHDLLLWETGTPGDDTWRLLGPLATLTGAMPVLRCDPGPGETLDLPVLPGYSGPVGITLGRSGGLRGPLMAHALSLNIPPPDCEARRRFWQATSVPVEPDTLEEIATRFLLTGGHISKTASLAHAYAVLDNRSAITSADVQQATRALNRQALETLATALEPANGWSDLIVGGTTAHELKTLEARCHGREALRERTGPALNHSLNRGVRTLFSGPSGTGKTLAARALAAALQMDLYRVDLAAVVNKYIGETERNLNQVLSRAEELDVVLLLDEGDALMTNRTEVRNANDRYANLETNYLLQRLENYEGIIIITTNAGNRIDTAFARRLDVIIDFAPPEAAERWLIWQSHLPQSHTVSSVFLEEVAGRCALTGGQIRNAALHATLLALGDGSQVGDAHLEATVQREYRKAGAACPLRPRTAVRGQVDRLRQFAAELG